MKVGVVWCSTRVLGRICKQARRFQVPDLGFNQISGSMNTSSSNVGTPNPHFTPFFPTTRESPLDHNLLKLHRPGI